MFVLPSAQVPQQTALLAQGVRRDHGFQEEEYLVTVINQSQSAWELCYSGFIPR